MILEPEALGLAQEIEGVARCRARADSRGRSSPSSCSAVLEIATQPRDSVGEAAAELRELRRAVIEVAGALGLLDRRASAPTRSRAGRSSRWSSARATASWSRSWASSLRQRAHLRHAHPRRHRGRRPRDLRRQRHPPLSAAAARPVGELAVLARLADRHGSSRTPDLPRLPRCGDPAAFRRLGRLLRAHRADGAGRGDRGLHVHLVGRPAAPAARHGRDADLRPADARRAHGGARGADRPPAHQPERPARRGSPSTSARRS